jgi:muconolactone delta-isomerase
MEYLVNMTTHVPAGTSDDDVEAIRTREAAHSRQLAAQGHLLRLWRPPLRPGEWRTLGLFAADDDVELEKVLASMPLRVWRTDEPAPLSPHPNDPAANGAHRSPRPTAGAEFLTTFTIAVPDGTPPERVRDTLAREAQRACELAEQEHLVRLWVLPAERGAPRVLGLWRARDGKDMQAILRSLPMDAWMAIVTTPLTHHPSDPETSQS